VDSIKACKAMKTGTASDFKASGKLKTCMVASYKSISKNRGREPDASLDQLHAFGASRGQ